jgi:MGT family glycosyltransferase
MSRGVFFCWPGPGHVNPTLRLVEELVQRGETIDYHCTEDFREVIERTGARFCPIGGSLARVKTLDPREGMFMLGEFMAEVTLELVPILQEMLERDPPDYVIHDTMTPWGRVVADLLRLPRITTFPSFATIPEKSPLPPLPILLLVMGAKRLPLNLRRLWRRRELTREAAHRFDVDELRFANVISNPSNCNIVFTSERFQFRRSDLDERFHFVGATLSEPPDPDFPLAALEGRRVVYVSLGTVFNDNVRFFRSAMDAFAGSDEMLVIAAGKRLDVASLGALPENCLVRPHVPQLEVLRRSALAIIHGGMNTVTGALYHGVPMLIRPQGADNFIIARRVEELGVGRRLGARDLRAARLRKLADELTSDARIRQNIVEVGDSLRNAGGAQRAADIVLRYRDEAKLGSSGKEVRPASPVALHA